jgi:DNA polymerase-3 subunit gamma/tau
MPDPRPQQEPYQVVARRFRPRTFADVVGQDAILASLRSTLTSQQIPHAFLFSGSRGVGKTTLARILARCLNCERGPTPDPCGTCELCRSILDGSNTDVVEIDAASNNKVEDVRALRESVGFVAMQSRYRVYILDEAHMMSRAAFNAFLKTLEEPPPNVVFVLATTELQKVPETVRSRCQVMIFRRIEDADVCQRLRMIADADGVPVADAVLQEIAAACRGGMRDAETELERVLPVAREQGGTFDVAGYRQLTHRIGLDRAIEVAAALLRAEPAPALKFATELRESGSDEREALGELVEVLRWCLLLKVDGAASGLVPVAGSQRQRLQELAASASEPALEAAIQAGILGRQRLRALEDRAAVLELSLLRMSAAGRLQSLADLAAEVRGGTAAPPRAAVRAAAPAAAPVVPAAAPAAASLRAAMLAKLAGQNVNLARTIERCAIEGPDAAGKVSVRLDTDQKVYFDRLSTPGVQQDIRNLVTASLGRPAAVDFQLGPQAQPAASAPAAAPAGEPGPRARAAMGMFGGRIVAVNPEDRPAPPAGGDEEAASAPPADQG